MDDLLPLLLSFPPHPPSAQPLSDDDYDGQIRGLLQVLNQTPGSRLTGKISGGGDLLDILDPSINTLPYLYALLAHINNAQNNVGKQGSNAGPKVALPTGPLWPKMVGFLERFDPVQVRYVGHEWRRVVEMVAKSARAVSKPLLAIRPIRSAILRLDPTSSCLTSTHVLFVRLCLEARAYRPAVPILNQDIYQLPSNPDKSLPTLVQTHPCAHHECNSSFITLSSGLTSKLDYRDHLEYFLYGAMLYMGLKIWERALLFLEVVIVAPTNNTASMIMVEAYKKWVLVGLLCRSGPSPMPRTTNSQAAKACRAIAKPYDVLADIFKSGDGRRLRAEFEFGRQLWREDCNTGLLVQVLDALRRFSIQKLENTYLAVSIPEVGARTSPIPTDHAETEAYIVSLISAGQLNATLSQSGHPSKPSILRFSGTSTTDQRSQSEGTQYMELVKQTQKIMKLAEHVRVTDKRLCLSKEYIEWAKKAKKTKEAGGRATDGNSIDMTGDDYGVDEDMMADL